MSNKHTLHNYSTAEHLTLTKIQYQLFSIFKNINIFVSFTTVVILVYSEPVCHCKENDKYLTLNLVFLDLLRLF